MQFRRIGFCISVFLLSALFVMTGHAQTAAGSAANGGQEPKPLSEDVETDLNGKLETITTNGRDIAELETRIKAAEGLTRDVLETRLDKLWTSTLRTGVSFADQVADLKDEGYDVSKFEPKLRDLLARLPDVVEETLDRVTSRVALPDSSASAAEQAAADTQFFASSAIIEKSYSALYDGIQVAGVDHGGRNA